jgi:hypothetical protein
MHGEDPRSFVFELHDWHTNHHHWDIGKKRNEADGGSVGSGSMGGGRAHDGIVICKAHDAEPLWRTREHRRYRAEKVSTLIINHRPNALK